MSREVQSRQGSRGGEMKAMMVLSPISIKDNRGGSGCKKASSGGGSNGVSAPPPPPKGIGPNGEDGNEIPDLIKDISRDKTYERLKFLGKGGFAKCYEVRETKSQELFACKIVSKSLLIKPHQREKMAQEISIHRQLDHDFIVKFYSYFEDELNVYVILELCTKKSLMEMQKRRRVVTETEAKYLFHQIMLALSYLHDKKIIHRDLKLGNIFINDSVNLKIGDFGLATSCERHASKRFTLCGTPNYIAPEVLNKKGHSFEVDIWSSGCILYTLLMGKPPFETATLKDTYSKIRKGDFVIPAGKTSTAARNLINKMLMVDPLLRPNARQVLNSEFFTKGFIPRSLPASVLTMAPRFESKREEPYLKPVSGVPPSSAPTPLPASSSTTVGVQPLRRPLNEFRAPAPPSSSSTQFLPPPLSSSTPHPPQQIHNEKLATRAHMRNLLEQLKKLVETMPVGRRTGYSVESEDPTAAPLLWIGKWVDYSDKYGFGYQLCDDSIGVSFNDGSKMVLLPDGVSLQYIEKAGNEAFYDLNSCPKELTKKIKLLNYFQQYMSENLIKAGGNGCKMDYSMARLPNLWTWFRTSRAVVMVLTNGTLQINNFKDHTKTILCPHLSAITTLETGSPMRTFRFETLEKEGYMLDLGEKIMYAIEKLEIIVSSGTGKPPNNAPVSTQENMKPIGNKPPRQN